MVCECLTVDSRYGKVLTRTFKDGYLAGGPGLGRFCFLSLFKEDEQSAIFHMLPHFS